MIVRTRTPTDLEEISEDECLQLLERHDLGRIAVVVDGQPLIFPVNYGLSHRIVTFRSAHGTKLSYAPGSGFATLCGAGRVWPNAELPALPTERRHP
jgi:hypothetical protein